MSRRKLSEDEIKESLLSLNEWSVNGKVLEKHFDFQSFAESLSFINKVGKISQIVVHHPDITFGWGYADIELTTHDMDGLTHNDFDVAKKIDSI